MRASRPLTKLQLNKWLWKQICKKSNTQTYRKIKDLQFTSNISVQIRWQAKKNAMGLRTGICESSRCHPNRAYTRLKNKTNLIKNINIQNLECNPFHYWHLMLKQKQTKTGRSYDLNLAETNATRQPLKMNCSKKWNKWKAESDNVVTDF